MSKELTLEQRIQRLEDIEAIKKLQANYGHYCDKGWKDKTMHCKEVALLFTEDATWESPNMGVFSKGRAEITAMFEDMDAGNPFFMHSFTNPIIDIDGDTAKAKWLLFVGGDTDEKATLTYGSYENKYVRTDQGWLIAAIRLDVAYLLVSA
jgi:hypothetical protein